MKMCLGVALANEASDRMLCKHDYLWLAEACAGDVFEISANRSGLPLHNRLGTAAHGGCAL